MGSLLSTASRMAHTMPTFSRTVIRPHPKTDQTSCDLVNTGANVFVSGQMGIDPTTGDLLSGGVEAETLQVMKNLEVLLEKGGSNFENVMKTNIMLADINDADKVNEIYEKYFKSSHGGSVFQATLPKGARVQIELTGLLGAFKLSDQISG